jgi:hypothetical protein
VPLLIWPWRDLAPDHPAFVAVNRMSAMGFGDWKATEVDFRPKKLPGEDELLSALTERFGVLAVDVWTGSVAIRGRDERKAPDDFDGDSIPDRDDALLLTPNDPIKWEVRVEPVVLNPLTDGLTPELRGDERVFDFGPAGVAVAKGFHRDAGKTFDASRGYGWLRDLSESHRKRGAVPEGWRDTFVFTRSEDTWELKLAEGNYEVRICIGDSGHPQPEQNLVVEGQRLVTDHSTAAGEWLEVEAEVEVKDGRLTLVIGRERGGANTCLNWVIVRAVDR